MAQRSKNHQITEHGDEKNDINMDQSSINSIPFTDDCVANVSMGFQQQNDTQISCPVQTPYTRKWTKQQDKELLKVIKDQMNGNTSDWKKIIQKSGLLNRTVKETRYRFKLINPVIKHFKWSEGQDEQLQYLYGIHGNQWVKISQEMGGKRTSNQVRQRYLNVINPKINRNPFSIQEDALILRVMKAVNDRNSLRKWQTISHIIGNGRTSNQLRGRFRQVLEQIWNESSNNIETAISSLESLHEEERKKQEANINNALRVVNRFNAQSTAVFAFGQNSYGELGIDDEEDRFLPTQVRFFRNILVSQVAAGNQHSVVVTADGHAYTFGFNGSGQLAVCDTRSLCHPRRVELRLSSSSSTTSIVDHNTTSSEIDYSSQFLRVKEVICGNGCEHIALIGQNGNLYTCGYNNYGQLGLGTAVNVSKPTCVQSLQTKNVLTASCSYYHTAVICGSQPRINQSSFNQQQKKQEPEVNTSVFTVGRNDSGQLGLGRQTNQVLFRPIKHTPLINVRRVACGLHHTVFVLSSGKVFSCGFNDNGQLGFSDQRSRFTPQLIETLSHQRIVDAACGYYHTLVQSQEGFVFTFGRNDKGQLGINSNVTSVSTPVNLKQFRIGYTFNGQNQIGRGHRLQTLPNVYSQSNSTNQNQGRRVSPSAPRVGNISMMLSSSARESVQASQPLLSNRQNNSSEDNRQMVLVMMNEQQQNQTVVDENVQIIPSTNIRVSKICCGCYHSMLLTNNYELFTFGRGNHGQLGHGGSYSDADNIRGESKVLNEAGAIYTISSGAGVMHCQKSLSEGANRLIQTIVKIPNDKLKEFPIPQSDKLKQSEFPVYEAAEGCFARVMIGKMGDVVGKIKLNAMPDFAMARLVIKKGAKANFNIDSKYKHGFLYCLLGKECRVQYDNIEQEEKKSQGQNISQDKKQLLIFGEGDDIVFNNQEGECDAQILMGAGVPLNENWEKLLGHNGFIICESKEEAEKVMGKIDQVGKSFTYKDMVST